MFQTHLCLVCDHPSPRLCLPLSLSLSRPSSAVSLPRNFSPCTSPRFLTYPNSQRPLSLSLSLQFHLLSHTRSPPTGEHSPCQTRIDLTLSVADYKSDQLGARCACRIGIGERSRERQRSGRALFENIPAQQPPTMHYRPVFATPSRRSGINIKCSVCEAPTLIGKRG